MGGRLPFVPSNQRVNAVVAETLLQQHQLLLKIKVSVLCVVIKDCHHCSDPPMILKVIPFRSRLRNQVEEVHVGAVDVELGGGVSGSDH
jgi:hypothetical protein